MLSVVLSFGALYAFIPIIIIIILIAAAAGLSRGWDIFTIFGFAVLTDFARGAGRGATGKGLNTSKYTAGAASAAKFRSHVTAPFKPGTAGTAAALGAKIGQSVSRPHQLKQAQKITDKEAAGKKLSKWENRQKKTIIQPPGPGASPEEINKWLRPKSGQGSLLYSRPNAGTVSTSKWKTWSAASLVAAGVIANKKDFKPYMKDQLTEMKEARAWKIQAAKKISAWGKPNAPLLPPGTRVGKDWTPVKEYVKGMVGHDYSKVFHPKAIVTKRQSNAIDHIMEQIKNDKDKAEKAKEFLEDLENKKWYYKGIPTPDKLDRHDAKKFIKEMKKP